MQLMATGQGAPPGHSVPRGHLVTSGDAFPQLIFSPSSATGPWRWAGRGGAREAGEEVPEDGRVGGGGSGFQTKTPRAALASPILLP